MRFGVWYGAVAASSVAVLLARRIRQCPASQGDGERVTRVEDADGEFREVEPATGAPIRRYGQRSVGTHRWSSVRCIANIGN